MTPRTLPQFSTALRRPLQLFVCHASDDREKIRELCQKLRADGFAPWLDEEQLLPGQEWETEIKKAVRQSDIVIVCLSPTAVSKTGYINEELRYALKIAEQKPFGRVFIVPVKLAECDVPESLDRWQYADLLDADGYERLARALRVHTEVIGLIADTAERAGKRTPSLQNEAASEMALGSPNAATLRRLMSLMNDRDSPPLGDATVPTWLGETFIDAVRSMLPLPDNAMVFNTAVPLSPSSSDENGVNWAKISRLSSHSSMDGFWSGRWRRSSEEPWIDGTAILKSIGLWFYIEYQDPANSYLIRARFVADNRLGGRFVNCSSHGDTSPWIGLLVGYDRIDGFWDSHRDYPGGARWDLRR